MDINQFRKHLARRQKLHEAPDYRIVSTNTLPLDSKINPNQDNIVVLLQWPDGTHTAGSGKTKEAAIQKAVEYHNHKPFTEATLYTHTITGTVHDTVSYHQPLHGQVVRVYLKNITSPTLDIATCMVQVGPQQHPEAIKKGTKWTFHAQENPLADSPYWPAFLASAATPALHEGVARKEHSTGTFHTIKAPGNRTLVFSDNELVGHIDFHEATPHVLPNSIDQHLVYVNGSYRDSRLKLQRPVFRKVGAFSSHSAALDALRAALANLRK